MGHDEGRLGRFDFKDGREISTCTDCQKVFVYSNIDLPRHSALNTPWKYPNWLTFVMCKHNNIFNQAKEVKGLLQGWAV